VKNSIKELYAYMKELKDNGLRDYQVRYALALALAHSTRSPAAIHSLLPKGGYSSR
jgi:hypothetical protein